MMNEEKLARLSRISIIALALLVLAKFLVRPLIIAVLPFAIAWVIAFALRGVSHKLARRIGVGERWIRLTLSLVVIAALVVGVSALLWYIVNKSWQFLSNIDQNDAVMDALDSIINGGFLTGKIFGSELGEYLGECISRIVGALLERLASAVSGFAGALPGAFIFTLVLGISTAYFAYDLERINGAVRSVLPNRICTKISSAKNNFFDIGIKYIRSYFILMLITVLTLLFGFFVIGVEYAGLLALFVGVLDILPVIGVGTVLVPWSIFAFITSDIRLGVGLAVIFLINAVVRQLIEPKIVGKSLGIHPVLTLVLIYAGYSFFGVWGMIILPPVGSVLLNKDNLAKIGKRTAAE